MVLKLTCKMSGFRSVKVTSMSATKVGTVHLFGAADIRERGRVQKNHFRVDAFRFSPASLSEHDNGTGAALEGSLDSTDCNGLCGVTGQMSDAAQLLKHLSVEHGRLCFPGNLDR